MAKQSRIDTASHVIGASQESVFAALADPAAWEQWLPPTGMTGSVEQFEFRNSGRYRLTLMYADGSGAGKTTSDEDIAEGTFIDIVPNERIVQRIEFESDDPSYVGAMLMTWSLEPFNNETRVTITAADVPSGISPEDHAVGMQSTLANLASFVEP